MGLAIFVYGEPMPSAQETIAEKTYEIAKQIQATQAGSTQGASEYATAGNQTTEIEHLFAVASGLGSTSDPAATIDTGTFSLIAFFKRLLEKVTTLLSRNTMSFIEVVIANGTGTPYEAGDVVGAITTLSDVNITGDTVARWKSLSVSENGGQAPALSFIVFRETPAGGTYNDNATVVWNSGDMAKRVGLARILTSDWYTVAGKSMVTIGGIEQVLGSLNTNYFILCIVDSAYTSSGTSAITAKFGFSKAS